MEMVNGSCFDEEWESILSKMFSGGDSLLHCDGGGLFQGDGGAPFLGGSDQTFDTNFSCISQESSNTSEFERTLFSNHPYIHDDDVSMSFYDSNPMTMTVPVFSDDAMEEILNSKSAENEMQTTMKRKYDEEDDQIVVGDHEINPKKMPRVSRNVQKKRAVSRKTKNSNGEDEKRQSSSSSSSEEEPNSESKGKSRATRGSATDPQSLYARKRRERINERLKVLQNLVPNGTKVDISTMLEEAVHYVKFLQLQIKLLSSDEMWMYAPLAYNGMDIGMYQKICTM